LCLIWWARRHWPLSTTHGWKASQSSVPERWWCGPIHEADGSRRRAYNQAILTRDPNLSTAGSLRPWHLSLPSSPDRSHLSPSRSVSSTFRAVLIGSDSICYWCRRLSTRPSVLQLDPTAMDEIATRPDEFGCGISS
jgi:hypothetical protein